MFVNKRYLGDYFRFERLLMIFGYRGYGTVNIDFWMIFLNFWYVINNLLNGQLLCTGCPKKVNTKS